MPRRKSVELTKEQVSSGYVLLDRTLDKPQHHAAARQFMLAALEYREFGELIELGGDDGALGTAEINVVYHALQASALLLYRDPKIRRRFVSVLDVHKALTAMMGALVGQPMTLPLHMFRRRGPPVGGEREYARWVEPGESFAALVRKAREDLGQHATHTQIWTYLGMPEPTYYRYLAKERRRYEIGERHEGAGL